MAKRIIKNSLDDIEKTVTKPLRDYSVGEEQLIVNRSVADFSKRISVQQNQSEMRFAQRKLLLMDYYSREMVTVMSIRRTK